MPEQVFILIFHGVGDPPRVLEPGEERVWVSRRSFCSVLDAAAERPNIRLSFDDANRSDYEVALPELIARDLRATFFVPAGRIGQPAFLSAEMIHEMVAAGMSFQSHGVRHLAWRGLEGEILDRELRESRVMIEEVTGESVEEAAIPYCQYGRHVLSAVRAAGYDRVFTCDRGPADPAAFMQARNQISCGEDAGKVEEVISPPLSTRLEIALKAPIKRWR
jgi:peptidoglycan/xylan/chitin deacetylase (PgdA/CDA1 family)